MYYNVCVGVIKDTIRMADLFYLKDNGHEVRHTATHHAH
jgi:hypothetical protein